MTDFALRGERHPDDRRKGDFVHFTGRDYICYVFADHNKHGDRNAVKLFEPEFGELTTVYGRGSNSHVIPPDEVPEWAVVAYTRWRLLHG